MARQSNHRQTGPKSDPGTDCWSIRKSRQIPRSHGEYPLVNVYRKLWTDPPFYSWLNQLFRLGHGFKFAKYKSYYQRVWIIKFSPWYSDCIQFSHGIPSYILDQWIRLDWWDFNTIIPLRNSSVPGWWLRPIPLNWKMEFGPVGMMKFPIWWESHKSHVPNHQPETQHLVSTRSVCGFWRTFNIEVLLNLSCSNPIESPLLWHFGMVSLSFFATSHGLCFANPRTNGSWGSGGACRNVFVCFFPEKQCYPTISNMYIW